MPTMPTTDYATDSITGQSYRLVDVSTVRVGMRVRRWHNREGVMGPVRVVASIESDSFGSRITFRDDRPGTVNGYPVGSRLAHHA
jgi:hypothetical protein